MAMEAMNLIPREFALGGVFFPPLLVAGILALALSWITAAILNRLRISRFFYYPPLVYVALLVIYTIVLSTFVFPS